MNNSEALSYIDRLWNKYGALYSAEKDTVEAALMQKYFEALGAPKDALEKMDKVTEAMGQIQAERDKSYACEAIGHGWGLQSALEILERAME